jgi:hypothetical protein
MNSRRVRFSPSYIPLLALMFQIGNQ